VFFFEGLDLAPPYRQGWFQQAQTRLLAQASNPVYLSLSLSLSLSLCLPAGVTGTL